jgi:hypothetical protein
MTKFLYKIEQKLTQNGNWKFLAGAGVSIIAIFILFAISLIFLPYRTYRIIPSFISYQITNFPSNIEDQELSIHNKIGELLHPELVRPKAEYRYQSVEELYANTPQPLPQSQFITETWSSRPKVEGLDYQQIQKNQDKLDQAKKSGDFTTIQNLQNVYFDQSYKSVRVSSCMDNIFTKIKDGVKIDMGFQAQENSESSWGSFQVDSYLGSRNGYNNIGKDIIGFRFNFSCGKAKYENTQSKFTHLDPSLIKIPCNEIQFLTQNFIDQLDPNQCVRSRDLASTWSFVGKNGVGYSWDYFGGQEIIDSLDLKIDLK